MTPASSFRNIMALMPSPRIIAMSLVMLVPTGCAMVTTEGIRISGGETVKVTVERNWPSTGPGGLLFSPSENDTVRITRADFLATGENRQLTHVFAFRLKDGSAPASVKVEDVSDEQAEILVTDTTPKPGQSFWQEYATPRTLADPHLKWLLSNEDTVRVYRFSIATTAAKNVVLYQAVTYTSRFKSLMVRILR